MTMKDRRYALMDIETQHLIAMQVKGMRETRGWSAAELAGNAGLEETDIDKMESPSNIPDLKKLKAVATACGVALLVRFVPFSYRPSMLTPPSFDEEHQAKGLEEGKNGTT